MRTLLGLCALKSGRPVCGLFACALLLASTLGVAAQTSSILTFDDYAIPGQGFTVVGAFPEEDGYVFSTANPNRDSLFAVWNTNDVNYRGSAALIAYTCCETVLSRADGNPFNLISMNFAGVQPFSSGTGSLSGYRGVQVVARQTFTVSAGNSFQIIFPAAFTNLNEVRWSGTPIQFDDLVVASSTASPARPLIQNFSFSTVAQGHVIGLAVNKAYALESSTNLLDWTTVRTWLATSTFEPVTDFRNNRVSFYRVREL